MSTNRLEDIYNFQKISDLLATAGQPTAEQFTVIKDSGYKLIINLALLTSDRALPNEKQIVESQNMTYIHIPVIWENPTIDDLRTFVQIMAANADQKIFVHCVANKRVSVFVYLYRRLYQGINAPEAKLALDQVWLPNQVWNKFITQVIEYFSFPT